MIAFDKDEQIVLEIHRHWYKMIIESVFFGIVAVLPPALFFVILKASEIVINSNFYLAFIFLFLIWLIIVWTAFFVAWTDYFLDLWIITNKRIIDIEQKGLFKRDIAVLPINQIQDIKIEIFGIINTLLKVGNIYIQSAAAQKEFSLEDARNPEKAKLVLMKLISDIKENKN